MKRLYLIALGFWLVPGSAGRACDLCSGNTAQRQTLRQDARQAKFVVYGTLGNPRLDGDRGGFTDLSVEHAVKDDPFLANHRTITINRYIPVDAKKPPRFLVFCDLFGGRVDAYRGVPVESDAVVPYLKGALAIPEQEQSKALLYHFRHLDSADPTVAADAFLEFAKASNAEVGDVARHLRPEKLRELLTDPKMPPERLGVFAFLLGACGTKADADLLSGMLARQDERSAAALAGLLGGLIELRPQEGWDLAVKVLRDSKRSFSHRIAVLGTLRFYHDWKPVETKQPVLRGLAALVEDGNMADMAVEDLRRWKWWELTNSVLAQYGKQTHAAPLVRRAILRYALCCPESAAADFVKARRALEADTVKEVEEGLEYEKPASAPIRPK